MWKCLQFFSRFKKQCVYQRAAIREQNAFQVKDRVEL